jgi:DNA-directed RNA polymerase subunit RPC12/RpoP
MATKTIRTSAEQTQLARMLRTLAVLVVFAVGNWVVHGLRTTVPIGSRFVVSKYKEQKTDVAVLHSVNCHRRVNQPNSAHALPTRLYLHDAVYRDVASSSSQSPFAGYAMKALEVAFNPIALVFVLYFMVAGYTQLGALTSNILTFLRLRERNKADAIAPDVPFQVFECEKCHMQMRPAKGRAEKILSREKFRCARCGSRASSYFNIDDMSDPRAVMRRERLEMEALGEEPDFDSDD